MGALAAGTTRLLMRPELILGEAVLAGAARVATRVVVCVLVQGNGVGGMVVAKDVAAATTVMATIKVGKGAGARGVIADVGIVIRLSNGSAGCLSG